MRETVRARIRNRVLALAAVAVCAAVALSYARWTRSASHRVAILASAAPTRRMFEGRITNFPYRRLAPETVRGAGSVAFHDDPRNFAFVAARHRAAGTDLSTADDYYVVGICQLLSGASDEAVIALERALRMRTGIRDAERASEASTDYALLSDLSTAYLDRGTSMRHASDYVRALRCADRAWRLRQTPETSWNRALALQRLHLNDDAKEMWQRYLQLDASSGWASEAREWAGDLRPPPEASQWPRDPSHVLTASRDEIERLARRFPLQIRRAAEKDVLPAWAAAVKAGYSATAAACLQRLDWIGAALARSSGESLIADVAANIRVVPDEMALASAVEMVSDGKAAYEQGDGPASRAKLGTALPELLRCRSPFAHYARFYIASSYYFDNDYASLRREASRLNDIPDRYIALRAQTSWILGLGEMSSGHPDGALPHYQNALATFTRLGELDYVAAVHNLLAEAYDYLDSVDDAWMHRERALALVSEIGTSSSQWVQLLQGSAQLLLANEQPSVAKILLDRAIKLPATAADPLFYADTVSWQAVALHQLGRDAEAQTAFKLANTIADKIPVEGIRARALNNVTLTRALTRTPDMTPREVESAVTFASHGDNRWALPRLLRLQADVVARTGNYPDAMRRYLAAIDEIVDQRRKTTLMRFELLNRSCLSDITENAMALALCRGDTAAAFRLSEHSAGAMFRASSPVASSEVPVNVGVVKIVSLSNRLVVWTLTAHGVSVRDVAIPIDRVRRAADEMSTSEEAASLLGKTILGDGRIGRTIDTLVFVPDATVAAVPFEELIDPDTDRRLIERYVIAQSPTVAAYLRSVAKENAGEAATPLLVEGAQSKDMAPLPEAADEIRRLRTFYPTAAVWSSRSGSIAKLPAALERAGMIHVAAHGVVDRTNELLSNVVLGDAGNILYAHDIAALKLTRHPIVVLSTCSGAATTASRRRRAPTLADAFLAAGASAVVASPASIDDLRARRVSILLHERLRRGVPVGRAVREIQLTFAREGRPSSDLVVVGNPHATLDRVSSPPSG